MKIEVGEIPLSHKRLLGLSNGFSFGEGKVGDASATLVVNETKEGSKGRIILETKRSSVKGEIQPVPYPESEPGSSAD